MNKYTLVNLMLGLEVRVYAQRLREAKELAVHLAESNSTDNHVAYWISKQEYHTQDFKVIS